MTILNNIVPDKIYDGVTVSDDIHTAVQIPAVSTFLMRSRVRFAVMVLLFLACAVWLQLLAGCYDTEFGGNPDEAAHFITGLMVRNYVTSGFKIPPMQFAEKYYLHYPKVAFGMWPPLFHFTEAAWFLIVPPSRASAFVLEALITALLATSVAFVCVRLFGWVIALAFGAAVIATPMVQVYTGMIMADNLMALLAFWAMLAFASYARRPRMKRAILFGVLAGLALMTKSNAACLALLPVVTLLLLRQYRRLYSRSLIVAGLLAFAMALPWQLLVIRLWTGTVSARTYSWHYGIEMLKAHTAMYLTMPGLIVIPLAVLGFIVKVIVPYRNRSIEPLWASNTGLIVSLFLFGFAPLPPEPRYHIAGIAGMVLFGAAGVNWLATRNFGGTLALAWRKVSLVAAATLLYALTTFAIPRHAAFGFREAARAIEANPSFRDSVILVSSQSLGEGMLIAEIALVEPQPTHFVLRASKMLSTSRWNLDSYELLYQTPEAIMSYLQSIPVRLLVMDDTPHLNHTPHERLLNAMLEQYKDKWASIGTYPASGTNAAGGNVHLYQMLGEQNTHGKIKIDMRYTLKKILQ